MAASAKSPSFLEQLKKKPQNEEGFYPVGPHVYKIEGRQILYRHKDGNFTRADFRMLKNHLNFKPTSIAAQVKAIEDENAAFREKIEALEKEIRDLEAQKNAFKDSAESLRSQLESKANADPDA